MKLDIELEALLFVADAPTPPKVLANALEATEAEVEQALNDLNVRLENSALQVVRIAGGLQLCTRSEHAERIAAFLKPQGHKLSRSLMEVLAIVAYKQPITQAEIDGIRGVQSDYGVKGLIERNLIQEVGRKQTPGRPVLFGTTPQFLHQFNLHDLSQLPPLEFGVGALESRESTGEGESIVVR